MKYIKLFETTSAFNAFKSSNEFITPNISLCTSENEVHYNPYVAPPIIIAKYNVTSTSSVTKLYNSNNPLSLKSMKIDDEEITPIASYKFSTTGEHTVKYTLIDPTLIGNNAFGGCSELTNITIPDSVTSINNFVFSWCTSLTSITIPNSVTSIGANAFYNCTGLTSITIGSGVTSIGSEAFNGCSGLTSVTIDSNNTTYDSRDNCNAIIETATNKLVVGFKNTVIPNSVTSIGNRAFSMCSGLTSITIPNSVTSIGNGAFQNCSGLTSITIGSGVTSISKSAFFECSGITSISIDANNQIYDSRNNCNAIIETTTNKLIRGCQNTVIPDLVTSIGDEAFYQCTGLTSITIPNSVTSIGNRAFNYCSSLTSIICNATTAPSIIYQTFQNVKTNGTLYVPSGSTGYDTWMDTGGYYLGYHKWTKVEQ